MLKGNAMTDATNTPAVADEFHLEVAVTLYKNGRPWTRQMTESMQMDQTNAVIGQHLVLQAVEPPLLKMGIASATAKDKEFMAKYSQAMAIVAAAPEAPAA
jgi:hypothetical protein